MQDPAETGMPDEALAAALVRRSRPALEEAYRLYSKGVYGIAYRLTGRASEAEEVLQDVFVGLPESARSYEGRGSFEGWLIRIAARMALVRNRTRERRREAPLDGGLPARADAGSWSCEWVTLERGLAELSTPLREVFILKEIEGFSHREVAGLLGIREGASKARLCRARKQLRRLFES